MAIAGTIDTGEAALVLHREGRIGQAAAFYDRAIAENPAPSAMLLHYAGLAWLSLGKPRKAERYLARAAEGSGRADFHFAHGDALHRLHRPAAAVEAYRRATALDRSNAALWYNLGNAAVAAKKPEIAAEAFQAALDNDPLMTSALANLATVLVSSGGFSRLAELLKQAHRLSIWREHFVGLALVGVTSLIDREDIGIAQPLVDVAAALSTAHPHDADVAWILGSLRLMQRDFGQAERDLERAVALDPARAEARRALAILLAAGGHAERARSLLADLVEDDPEARKFVHFASLFIALSDKSAPSIRVYEIAAELYPHSDVVHEMHFSSLILSPDPEAVPDTVRMLEARLKVKETANTHINLGATLQRLKQDGAALRHFRRAVEMDKRNFAGWHNLSGTLLNQGRVPEAHKAARRAVRIDPTRVEGAMNLSLAASKLGLVDQSERALKRGLKYNPMSPELLNLLGNTKMRRGNMTAALAYFDKARAHVEAGRDSALFAMQLMAVNYSAEVSPEVTASMHLRWGKAMVASMAHSGKRAGSPAEPKSRLKIGYVSGDYRNHSCSYFLGPLLSAHDPLRVDVHCYMTEGGGDDATLRFKRTAPHWREVHDLTDGDFADLIRKDGIDILVDLSGHTSGARLAVFAIKPAPLQVTWLGYPNTTGLDTVDYRITSDLADPVGTTEPLHSERLYRLPHFLCYRPPEFTPPVGPLPFDRAGRITFGCFNNSNKITDEVVATWGAIMARVPGSQIFLKTSNLSDQLTLDAFRRKFEKAGIEAGRVECFPSFPSKYDHLMTYGEVDLALDPFPYNGTTTTFEALWMGVPMITLAGRVHAARVGHAILTGMGLGELVADTQADYVEKAVALALDPARIALYRTHVRGLLQASPLMDAKAFAQSMENAYHDMWNHAVNESRPPQAAGRQG